MIGGAVTATANSMPLSRQEDCRLPGWTNATQIALAETPRRVVGVIHRGIRVAHGALCGELLPDGRRENAGAIAMPTATSDKAVQPARILRISKSFLVGFRSIRGPAMHRVQRRRRAE
jgi:hypothetical protein